ncbi:MAG: hypothetical protein ABI834_00840 [Ginsengibacter sp.]
MSIAEMKKVINEKVENLNESQLKVILKIIEEANDQQKEIKFNAESFFEEVVTKYGNVLQKLAH